jgi:hypothetical protein
MTCDGGCVETCCPEASAVAQLIYLSQTACSARQRRTAVHRLSDRYDCLCYPEVMSALLCALRDADDNVRSKAADEIGDQLRKNPCCCCEAVVSALTCALGDCDRMVRHQAEQALRLCGYEIVDPCDTEAGCDADLCSPTCCPVSGVPAPLPALVPAPSSTLMPDSEPVTQPEPGPMTAPEPKAEPGPVTAPEPATEPAVEPARDAVETPVAPTSVDTYLTPPAGMQLPDYSPPSLSVPAPAIDEPQTSAPTSETQYFPRRLPPRETAPSRSRPGGLAGLFTRDRSNQPH